MEEDSKGNDWNGRLVVRIIPKSIDRDYENCKPSQSTASSLTRRRDLYQHGTDDRGARRNLKKKCEIDRGCIDDDIDKCSCILFELFLTKQSTTENLKIGMKRDPNEKINTTLRRLELSIAKKLSKTHDKKGNGKKKSYMNRRNVEPEISTSKLFVNNQQFDANDMTSFAVWKSLMKKKDGHYERSKVLSPILIVSLPAIGNKSVSIPLEIISCPPTIISVKTFESFQAKVFVGVPICIQFELMFASCAIVDWCTSAENEKENDSSLKEPELCFANSYYTPAESDVGKTLSVVIIPCNDVYNNGYEEEIYTFQQKIEALPRIPIVQSLRREWTVPRTPWSNDDKIILRCMSYNILADNNAYPRGGAKCDTETKSNSLYPHCKIEYLDRKRRMPLILYEIISYSADIICLQEVDLYIFDTLFKPTLEEKGYQGIHSCKLSPSPSDDRNEKSYANEGCAMFWSLTCFEKCEKDKMNTYPIRELFLPSTTNTCPICNRIYSLSSSSWKSMTDITKLLYEHEALNDTVLKKLGHVLQAVTLTFRGGKRTCIEGNGNLPDQIVLANTHLFFHPNAGHIRVMQLLASFYKIEMIRKQFCCCVCSKDTKQRRYPFIFCGDFNANAHDSGGAELLFNRAVYPNHNTWRNFYSFSWETMHSKKIAVREEKQLEQRMKDKGVYPPTISFPRAFQQLCNGYGVKPPDFTHLVPGYKGVLDYILAAPAVTSLDSNNLETGEEYFMIKTKAWAPLPALDDIVMSYVSLPNEGYPSDHLSLLCDLEVVAPRTSDLLRQTKD